MIQIKKTTQSIYCDSLIGSLFKILGIFEGKDNTKCVVYNDVEAHRHFQCYLSNLCAEINGAQKMFGDDISYIKLSNSLEGMKDIKINEHEKLRRLAFNCISLVKRMKDVGGCDT